MTKIENKRKDIELAERKLNILRQELKTLEAKEELKAMNQNKSKPNEPEDL